MRTSNAKVFLFAGYGKLFGTGHMVRMKVLQYLLKQKNITTRLELITCADEIPSLDNGSIIVLDARDMQLPLMPSLLERTIIIDNRSNMRARVKFVWDTLPHIAMNTREFKQCLQRFLLKPNYDKYRKAAATSKLRLIPYRANQPLQSRLRANVTTYKWLHHTITKNYINRVSLSNSQAVVTYFGQTLFEALYMGKDVELYSISNYHWKLAENFYRRWSALSTPRLYLDGKGYARLTQLIDSLILS